MQTDHHASIEAIADAYLQGVFHGDTATLATLFEPSAQVYGQVNGQAYLKTIAAYLEGVAARQSPFSLGEPYRMRVLSIDRLANIATVKLYSPMLGFNYHLYLTVRRIDGKWLIVNKTFTHIDAA
jgi:hypothetical protein